MQKWGKIGSVELGLVSGWLGLVADLATVAYWC